MRKIILQFMLAGCVFPAAIRSQTLNHRWLFETTVGNVSLGNTHYKFVDGINTANLYIKYFSLRANPTFGYFLIKNLALGATTSFACSSSKARGYNNNGILTSESEGNSASLIINPFVRYYFGKDSKTRFYVQANGTLGTQLYKSTSKGYDNGASTGEGTTSIPTDKTYGYGGSIGLNHFINESVALNVNIGYNYFKDDTRSAYDYNSIYGSGKSESKTIYQSNYLTWNLGLTCFLDHKKKSSESKTVN